jgi:hypothetical protein
MRFVERDDRRFDGLKLSGRPVHIAASTLTLAMRHCTSRYGMQRKAGQSLTL